MSQSARSSASSAASPPRAKSATARPTRPPPSRRPSSSPDESSAARPLGLELEQPPQLRARPVELLDAEAAPVLRGQVDAPEREVARHVLQEVDELQPGADVVGERDRLQVVAAPEHAEHEPPDRIGRVDAVALQVGPGLVGRDALIHPVRLDQAQERLARQRAGADRRLQLAHHLPGRLAFVAGLDLSLELVERRQPVPFVLVAEDVHQPGEAVDRAQVRTQRAREEERGDGEVLRARPGGDRARGGRIHAQNLSGSARHVAVAEAAHRLDRLGRDARRGELAAQVADVELDLVARGAALAAPRELEQLVVGEQLAGVVDERGQEPELERRQLDRLVARRARGAARSRPRAAPSR